MFGRFGPSVHLRYAVQAYAYLPVTFGRRVVFGRDPYWRQYFWNRWGVLPQNVVSACRGQKVIWIDALSGGEVMQSFSFCRTLRRLLPGHVFVFSSNSLDALRAARQIPGIDHFIDTPWDLPWVVRRALRQIRPQAVVAIQTPAQAMWLREAQASGIPTVLVSGFMSEDWAQHPTMARPVALEVFKFLDYVGAKSDDDFQIFKGLGIPFKRLEEVGDLKCDFEQFLLSAEKRAELLANFGLQEDTPVLLGGSLNHGEEGILTDAYLKAKASIPELRLIIAPRYLDRLGEIERCLELRGCRYVRRSGMSRNVSGLAEVVLLDTFGELARLYAIATVVVLGVTLIPRFKIAYGQNILEPLIQGKPVLFGPYARRSEKITRELEGVWDGLRVRGSEDIARAVVELVTNPARAELVRKKAEEIVERHSGAARRNAQFVADVIQHCEDVASPGSA